MNKILNFLMSSLLTTMMFSFSMGVNAQIITEQTTTLSNYDPIAATLDSLVNLAYVKRVNLNSTPGNTGTSNFQPYEVPHYSPEVYATRISKIQTPIPLCYNSQVQQYIDMYAMKKRDLTARVMGLSGLYFPLYEQILDQQGLPLEFKYLSIVESALNPMAVSRVGATGLWQFMLGTGKLYDLKINSFIDERRDPAKSTYAACQYFKDMYAIYNDWLLVIAAYNCGAGNVNRAIARSGGKRTFWEICPYLPKETRGYVPAFIAVTYLMNYPGEHNLTPVSPIMTYFEADTVMTDQRVSLKAVADAINVPVEMLMYLNPMYKRGVIPDSDEPQVLRLPTSKINAYLANISNIYRPDENTYASIPDMQKSYDLSDGNSKYHKVKKGEHLQGIANRYSISVSDLKKWNHIKGNSLKAGQKLLVFVPAKKPVAKSTVAVSTTKKPAVKTTAIQDGSMKYVWHTVQAGDSLWKIAQRYEGATVDQIKSTNNLQSNELKVGTRLKVVVS